MSIKNPVIVTALFDIGRDKWQGYEQSYGTYLYWMSALLMYDTPMVIYTDENLYEEIKKKRMVCDPQLEKTIFEVKKVEDLIAYKIYYEKVKNLMESEDFQRKIHFRVPEMVQPLYNIVIFNKVFYIKESIEKKHFDSDFYIWADAGVLRHEISNPIKGWPNLEKINDGFYDKMTFFNHQDTMNIPEHTMHLLSQYRFIHGGCFFVPNNGCLDKFINVFISYIDFYLKEGLVGSEEKYYDFCCFQNIEDYNILKSDWRQYFEIFK
jgi:hypothetical protein